MAFFLQSARMETRLSELVGRSWNDSETIKTLQKAAWDGKDIALLTDFS